MALPATIQTSWHIGDGEGASLPPIEYSGNLYAVLGFGTTGVDTVVGVFKSTDGGDTWSEMDSASHPQLCNTANQRAIGVIKATVKSDGTAGDVLVVTASGLLNRAQTKCYWQEFNLATDTWGTAAVSGGASQDNGAVGIAGELTHVVRRSDGSTLVIHTSPFDNIMGTNYRRFLVQRWSGTTWQAQVGFNTTTQAHYDLCFALLGSSDRAHILFTDATNGDYKQVAFLSTNSMGTAGDIDTTAASGNWVGGHAVMDSSTIRALYTDSNGDLIEASATSADSPTWSTSIVTATNRPEITNSNPGSITMDGSVVYHFWPNDADQDIYRDSSSDGTDVEWKDAITCQHISINKITDAIGVLYDDGGTVKYDKYALALATAAPFPPYPLRRFEQRIPARRSL